MYRILVATATLVAASPSQSASPDELMRGYAQQARGEVTAYAGPSAAAGQRLFVTRHGNLSCSTCHGRSPAARGRHAMTGKAIAPLAPAANTQRFRDPARVEKWFRRNCNDTLDRACTAAEKADVIAYLLTVRTGA